MSQRDPEQEVQGLALPVLDACLVAYREFVPTDPVASAIRDLVSPEAIESGEPVRAVDAALVAGQLAGALGPETLPPPPPISVGIGPRSGLPPSW